MTTLDAALARARAELALRREGEITHRGGSLGRARFCVASVSKQFVGCALQVAARSHGVGLDDPVAEWFAGASPWWGRVSARQLLTHTAGFGHWDRVGGSEAFAALPAEDRLERIASLEPLHEPGERWHYSGLGYLLVAELVARITGRPYSDYLETAVLQPLGLTATSSGASAAPFTRTPGEVALLSVPGTGDLWSTPADVTAFSSAMRVGDVIGAEAARDRVQPWASLGAESYDLGYASAHAYGYGLFVGTIAGEPAVFHPGDVPGWQSFAASFTGTARDLCILSADESVDMRRLVQTASALLRD